MVSRLTSSLSDSLRLFIFTSTYMKKSFLIISLHYFLSISVNAQEVVPLLPEKVLNMEIGQGETQIFEFRLREDELAFIRFNQMGADIKISVKNPDASLKEEFNSNNGRQGPELVHILPSESGIYTLEVNALEVRKKKGVYTVEIDHILPKAPDTKGQLDQLIQYWEAQAYLPGFAAAIVTAEEVLFQKAYGFSDLDNQLPYTLHTIQNIGSVSKTLIGISLMKAVEEGKLSLADDINQYLPYRVFNPYFPTEVITVKQLAIHTSSINEMNAYEKSYILKEPFIYRKNDLPRGEYKIGISYTKNKPIPMSDFLEAILSEEGDLYAKKNTYRKNVPGSKYYYSNAAATLAAHIIEIVYGMPYDEFTQQHILNPLGMQESGWSFDDVNMERHADLYFTNQAVIPKYTLITYPDGGLLTNIKDLSNYLQAMMKGYEGKGDIISPASYQEMMKGQLTKSQQEREDRNYGIFWEIREDEIGHSGGDPGIVCLMRFNHETGVGRILMTNIVPLQPMPNKQFGTIWSWLDSFGEKIVEEKKVK